MPVARLRLRLGLMRDARRGARAAESPAEWRTVQAILSEVYSLAQFFAAYQPDRPAPGTSAYNGSARRIVLEEAESRSPERRCAG